jgi:hypothetical protein
MATTDRTTIRAAFEEFVDKLRTNLMSNPPTPSTPFRTVRAGGVGAGDDPRPVLGVRLTVAKLIGVVDDDKVLEVQAALTVVVDALSDDPHGAVLDAAGAVDDYLDSIVDDGVLDGSAGFDDRSWKLALPEAVAGARRLVAEISQPFVVKVQRGYNRVPAA